MTASVAGVGEGWGAPRAARATPRLSFNPFDPKTPHLRFAVVSILVLWLIVLTGVQLLPSHYVSRATLIIPGATTSVNVALDKIGQASTAPVSAYNTGHMSPKVIYKEMAQSDEVRGDAARSLGVHLSAFVAPRIKLVDETPLVHIEMRHRDPDIAWRHGVALIDALQRNLDRLRADELEKRSLVVRANLVDYEKALEDAREAIVRHQTATGLQATGQFSELSAALVQRARRHAEFDAEVARLETEQATLSTRLGVTPAVAARALKAVADPTLTKWLGDYADATAALTAEMHRLGDENPHLLNLRKRRDAVTEHLRLAASARGLDDPASLQMLVLLSNASHQADLFRRLVANEAALDGKRVERDATQRELRGLEVEHARLGRANAELEDLKKQLTIVEAVYSTASARIASTRSDVYGSYPLLQTLAAPSRPVSASGSQVLFAIAGGLLGTFVLALAWFLAWLRTGSVSRRPKNA